MSAKIALVLGSFLVASTAFAQSLGSVGSVDGVVTVTDGVTGGTVVAGSPITDGMRFVTATGSSVTLKLNSGCVVTLQPNNSITVLKNMTCQELASAAQRSATNVMGQSGGFVTGGSFTTGALAVGGMTLITGVASKQIINNNSTSNR